MTTLAPLLFKAHICQVFDKRTGKTKEVTNLGWLLKHASEVTGFSTEDTSDGGALLVAWFPYGHYKVNFASAIVMRRWLRRPSFIGLKLNDRVIPPLFNVEWEVRGNYGQGYECVTSAETFSGALQYRKEYCAKEPNISFKIKRISTKNTEEF